ncbi:MAG: hypothetical protein IT428_00580 [Planctomycetaceae bacterium]|nr:hypothetical protein [Planctomycetaceae bacterium]
MSNKRTTGPIPPANRSPYGPSDQKNVKAAPAVPEGEPMSNHDPQRRLGNFETAGEHSVQQPGGKQGANRK